MTDAIPRLELDQLEPALAAALAPRVERLGYLGEFFKCAGHQPQALRAFIEFTESSKAGLDEALVEVLALTVAVVLRNTYERNQHERLCVRLGFSKDWIKAVEALSPDAEPLIKDDERLVQQFVIAALNSHGRGATAHLQELAATLGPQCAIAVLMVLGRYTTHALIVNSLGLDPPVPSVFEDGFEA